MLQQLATDLLTKLKGYMAVDGKLNLRLRTILFIGFSVVAVIPVMLLGWWVNDSALKKEYDAVEEKHLLVAKNLTNALSRYVRDVSEVFMVAEHNLLQGEKAPPEQLTTLFKSLQIMRICRIFPDGGKDVYHNLFGAGPNRGLTQEQVSSARKLAKKNQLVFLPVMPSGGSKSVITIVHLLNDGSLVIGELITNYIVELQQAITFGEKGHAAIVDQYGNVLAHPKQAWVDSRKNISKIKPVKRMISRTRGVSFFYSPAIKADMVAGYSYVPETGWGAMIPQPVSELHAHAAEVTRVATAITIVGIVLGLTIAWGLAYFIARPTVEVARIARSFGKRGGQVVQVSSPYPATLELTDLVNGFNRMMEEVNTTTKELEYLADHDPLTRLPNRTLLKTHISQLTEQVLDEGTHFTLLFLDLDEFKEVNDTLGHGVGDVILKQVAERLDQAVGQLGLVSRQGGDEFAIVLDPSEQEQLGEELSRLLIEIISEPYYVDDEEIVIGTSIGIARCPRDAEDMDTLLRYADLAMYAAKADPEQSYHTYTEELHDTLSTRKALEAELRQALINEEFELHYQPKVDIETGNIMGFEALVRWQHPRRGLVMPNEFIAISERTGEIVRLGDWVIRQACIDHLHWCDEGLGEIKISINLSERQFQNNSLVERIEQIFDEMSVDPELFEFEITESLAMHRPARTIQMLEQLSEIGFQFSIDDFGTGYSSLERLKQLPIDKIKIDKSFVDGIGKDTGDSAIVEHIVSLSAGLSLDVVAEGIETPEQLEFLQKAGCTEIQGYIYSKAVSLHEASELLKRQPLSYQ